MQISIGIETIEMPVVIVSKILSQYDYDGTIDETDYLQCYIHPYIDDAGMESSREVAILARPQRNYLGRVYFTLLCEWNDAEASEIASALYELWK